MLCLCFKLVFQEKNILPCRNVFQSELYLRLMGWVTQQTQKKIPQIEEQMKKEQFLELV